MLLIKHAYFIRFLMFISLDKIYTYLFLMFYYETLHYITLHYITLHTTFWAKQYIVKYSGLHWI